MGQGSNASMCRAAAEHPLAVANRTMLGDPFWPGRRPSTGRSARGARERAVNDPELTPTALGHVAAQRWKPVIRDERAVET